MENRCLIVCFNGCSALAASWLLLSSPWFLWWNCAARCLWALWRRACRGTRCCRWPYLGNLLPIPFALFFGKRYWTGWDAQAVYRFVTRYKAKLESKKDQVTKYARIGLFLFVAVPLPGTGAWSGRADRDAARNAKGKALLSIAGGVVAAGLIMLVASNGVLGVARPV